MEEDQMPNKDSSQTTEVKKRQETKRYSEIFRDFENFEFSLISEQSDLLGDNDSLSISEPVSAEIGELTEQPDESSEERFSAQSRTEPNETDVNAQAQEADLTLCRCEDGVETALQYAKMWCRYAKDILAWMEKRISLEQEFAKNVMKASDAAKATVTQQDMMPLQHIYIRALDQDMKNGVTTRKTFDTIQSRCYQALAAKRNEIDKWRREFKEQWAKEQRRMSEAVTALKKARQQYFQRGDELEKAKAISAKAVDDTAGTKTLDKRRKSKDEAQTKVLEAENQYKQCVNDAKLHQDELVKVKERIISHTRKLICQGDTVLKEATVNMFYFQRQLFEAVPLGFQNLEMTCRSLEPGEPYLHYILRKHLPEQPLQVFSFQEYNTYGKGNKPRKTSNTLGSGQDLYYMIDDSPYKKSSESRRSGYSDSESFGGSSESLSSPGHARLPKTASTLTVSSDDLDEKDLADSEYTDGHTLKVRTFSQAALTHRLKKTKSKMMKCKQCDNYIVVGGIECEECGLALHRKCMEVCQLECEHRKGNVFGVDLSLLPRDSPNQVPFVVLLCTSEIESRALSVQGVYRVSGSKPRIQKICQALELQKEQVDLSDLSPHDITSILKHFFKELPEPLLTFDLYNDFIAVGKTIQHFTEREPTADTNDVTNTVQSLQKLLQKLPPYCYITLQHLMSHLQKVSENVENKMSPSNLGIVFGPTLLRPLVSTDMSMLALLETSYQAVLIEFLITHYDKVFGLQERSSTPPAAAPVPHTPPKASCPLDRDGYAGPENDGSSRERPRSLESRTIKRDSSEGYISDKSSSNEAVDQLSPEATERAVVAMRGASYSPLGEPLGEPDSSVGTQPNYRFTRQRVKYYRHHNAGTRLSNPGGSAIQPDAPEGGCRGSSHRSRSSSPEPETHRHCQNSDARNENACQPLKATGNKVDVSLSPREVVQYMLGLDSEPTAPGTAISSGTRRKSPQDEAAACQRDQNMHLTGDRRSQTLGRAPKAGSLDFNTTSPAQKILSGLKLRRSHSGKDEQLFV